MPSPSLWGMTPRQSIEAECSRRGHAALVAGCISLLDGKPVDEGLLLALGGPPARHYISRSTPPDYWLRVWAVRGLLWAWDDSALPALEGALADDHWRVREMALKVVARHRLGEAMETAVSLRADAAARVRAAADRAVVRLTQGSA